MVSPSESYLHDRLLIFRGLYDVDSADALFETLHNQIEWLHPYYDNADERRVYIPRLTANYGEASYNYSGLTFTPKPWTPQLKQLKQDAEALSGETFNALILQQYRDGQDRVNWHSDDDPCVGTNPTIVSFSFGASRDFVFRAKDDKKETLHLRIHHGDGVIMRGDLQHTHVHKVPKEATTETRINLTFRKIVV